MKHFDVYPEELRNAATKRLSEEPTIHDPCVLKDCKLGAWTEIGANSHFTEVEVGDYSYTAGNNEIVYTTIGKFTSIATDVRINPGNHPQWRVTQHHCTYRRTMYGLGETDDEAFFDWRREHHCTIGHDVWLGHGVTIMPGVTIGNGAIVGSGAVVTKDVAPYSIAVGVAAKTIKQRFSDDIAQKLEQIQWWNWNRETLETRFAELNNLETFLEKYA